ncbi:ZIP family metal transporter [Paenisporosarcina quisquiliarum]|uniref:ZIP family metal transporter n=1 Tax=Paenisporosarcina quisquiliarum TaxID=365346 RepID=UPI0037351549
MSSIWVSGTLLTMVGFGLGGFIAWFTKGLENRTDVIYCICGGLILGLLSFEVVPEAIEMGNWWTVVLGVFLGLFMFVILHRVAAFIISRRKKGKNSFAFFTGLMLLFGIAIHNFPIGISLGVTSDPDITRAILQTILLHNVPEGIIVFTPLFMAGIRKRTCILLTLLVSLPVGAGAFVGRTLGIDNPLMWSLLMSLSIGMIYMVTIKEILVEAVRIIPSFQMFILALLGFGFIGIYFSFI